jgi:hypothetical protein
VTFDRTKVAGCVAHSGADPTQRGGPSRRRAALLRYLFRTDEDGRRYFRADDPSLPGEGFVRIFDRDFSEISRILAKIEVERA